MSSWRYLVPSLWGMWHVDWIVWFPSAQWNLACSKQVFTTLEGYAADFRERERERERKRKESLPTSCIPHCMVCQWAKMSKFSSDSEKDDGRRRGVSKGELNCIWFKYGGTPRSNKMCVSYYYKVVSPIILWYFHLSVRGWAVSGSGRLWQISSLFSQFFTSKYTL